MTITGKTAGGAAWLMAARLTTKCFDLIVLAILGRMLGPEEFGLVAIAMGLIIIVETALEIPVIQALVSLGKTDESHLDTAFTISLVRGAGLAALVAGLAVPFADIYGDHRLVLLTLALSLAPIARGLYSPAMSIFNRNLSFVQDFFLEVTGKALASIIALMVAYSTGSYWAIAAATITSPTATVLISYYVAPYRPRLSLKEWRHFAHFLGWTSASAILTGINWQCDRLLLGRFVSRTALGNFSMANDLSNLPPQALVVPLLRPLTAGFALVSGDLSRLRAAYLKANATLLVLGLPLIVAIAALAVPIVALILGDRWQESGYLLQWLALFMIPSFFVSPAGPLAMSRNRNDIMFRQHAAEFIVKVPAIIVGAAWFGVQGVLWARGITSIFVCFYTLLTVRRLTALPIRAQMLEPWRTILSALVMGIMMHLISNRLLITEDSPFPLAIMLAVTMILGGALYGLCLISLWLAAGRPDGVEARLIRIARQILEKILEKVRVFQNSA